MLESVAAPWRNCTIALKAITALELPKCSYPNLERVIIPPIITTLWKSWYLYPNVKITLFHSPFNIYYAHNLTSYFQHLINFFREGRSKVYKVKHKIFKFNRGKHKTVLASAIVGPQASDN